jgi:tripartite-type tricarboxylate transporter receptor subunit TctC
MPVERVADRARVPALVMALRASLLVVMSILASSLPVSGTAAQTSGGTMRVIYAFAAGGSGDGLARLVADRLGTALGTPGIVENRSGASGRIGTRAVISAPPDGNTLLISAMGPIALHPIVYNNLDFDPFSDLAPLSQLATFDIALVLSSGQGARSVDELVAWIKANPDRANYGTPGLGGLPHFFAVMFSTRAGVTLRNVPYRGSAAVTNDLVSGQLPIAFVPTAENVELHKGGQTRILATSGALRSPFLANVPTFKESGLDLVGEGWFGLYAPAKTPRAIIDKLGEAVVRIMREPELRGRIEGLGLVPTGTDGATLDVVQKASREGWGPAIRASGFKPND